MNRSVADVLHEALHIRSDRIACVVINEQPSSLGGLLLETMLPDRVEYIDVIEFGLKRDSLMVRIYTRDYFPALMGSQSGILTQDQLMLASRIGRCR